AIRSNSVRTASGASLPLSTVTSVASPTCGLVLDAELVESARDDKVSALVDRVRAVVEAGRQEEDRRTGLLELEHVPQMDVRERRLARADDQTALLLQRHAGGPVDQVRHRAGGDRAERP